MPEPDWANVITLNGYRLVLTDDEAYELTVDVARGKVGKDAIVASIEKSVLSD